MESLGLDPTYGSYVEMLPGVTLAGVNLVSMFALHRKWRGALVGQLAIHELASLEPMQRYSRALDHFGIAASSRRFYDAHVNTDLHHASLMRGRLVTGLLDTDPDMGPQVIFGAAAELLLEERFTHHVRGAWENGLSSLAPWEMNSNP